MFKNTCSASALVLFASVAHADGLELNFGGVGEDDGSMSAYANVTYSFDKDAENGVYLRFSAVRSEYDYQFGGVVDGLNQQVAAIVGYEVNTGNQTFQIGVGYAFEQVTETGGGVDIEDSFGGIYAEVLSSLETPTVRSTSLVQYKSARGTVYGETGVLFQLMEDSFLGPIATVFDQEDFSRYQIGLRAEFDIGANDQTVISFSATTGERTIGASDAESTSMFGVNVYHRY